MEFNFQAEHLNFDIPGHNFDKAHEQRHRHHASDNHFDKKHEEHHRHHKSDIHFEAQHISFKHVGKDFDKVVKAAEKAATKVLKAAGADAEDLLFAPLLIFKAPMTKHLDTIGVAHDNTITDIATKFAAHTGQHFDGRYHLQMHKRTGRYDLDSQEVQQIIHTILDFFRAAVGLPPGAPMPAGVDPSVIAAAQAQLEGAAHAAAKDAKAKDTADAGIKGNLFGKKFDLEAFFSSPKKLIGTITIILGFVAVIYWMKHDGKKAA